MSHIVESCPLTKLNGGLSRIHSVDEDADQLWFMTRISEEEDCAYALVVTSWTCYGALLVVILLLCRKQKIVLWCSSYRVC